MARTNGPEARFLLFVLLATPAWVSGFKHTTTSVTRPTELSASLILSTLISEIGTEPGSTPRPSKENGTLGELRPRPETLPIRNHTEESPRQNQSTAGSTPALPVSATPAHLTDAPNVHSTLKPTSRETAERATDAPPCPTPSPPRQQGLVGRCLITIGVLASVATAFVASTVVLATKLSTARRRIKAGLLDDTEMICISTLVSDSDHPMARPKHPKSNGALIPVPDSEGDDADNLTLNSFLPETEIAP